MNTQDNALFDKWNNEKKSLHIRKHNRQFISPKEIWYVKLGKNIGYEENGKGGFVRPVLVISKVGSMFFIVPLSTKIKTSYFYYILNTSSIITKQSCVLLSQCKVLDANRFIKHIGNIHKPELTYIKKLLTRLYFE